MLLDVSPKLLDAGLSAAALIARNVDNTRTSRELIAYRRAVARKLAVHWKNRSVSTHPIIREYHQVHEQFGAFEEPPAPEKLISFVRRNRDFTASGAVVDCYNIVSARTLLSIGAHDLDKLAIPITLRTATSKDVFVPLGETESQNHPGEYAYVDALGSIICRLDVLQCEQTKTTRESHDIVFFLQGNRCLSAAALLKGAWLLSEMIATFCGGTVELVAFFAAGRAKFSGLMKPQVSFDAFKHLNLQKGTVQTAAPLSAFADLSAVTVRCQDEIEALALSSAWPAQTAGVEVIVATGLHPLVVAGKAFTTYLPSLYRESRATQLQISAGIPDGARLY